MYICTAGQCVCPGSKASADEWVKLKRSTQQKNAFVLSSANCCCRHWAPWCKKTPLPVFEFLTTITCSFSSHSQDVRVSLGLRASVLHRGLWWIGWFLLQGAWLQPWLEVQIVTMRSIYPPWKYSCQTELRLRAKVGFLFHTKTMRVDQQIALVSFNI